MVNEDMKGMRKLKSKGDKYSDKIRSMTKGSSSFKRKIAAKINAIPRMNKEKVDKAIYDLITNPEISAIQIQELIRKALKRKLSDANFINLINTCIKKHSAIFGNKLELDARGSFDIRLKEWREKVWCIKVACTRMVDKAKVEKKQEWIKRFGEEQGWEMINCLEEFLNDARIEEEAEKMRIAREMIDKQINQQGEE